MIKYCLKVDNIPANYKFHEQVVCLHIDISGIQKYIFSINGKEILEEIRKRSKYVSFIGDEMSFIIQETFSDYKPTVITKSGGKLQMFFKKSVDTKMIIDLVHIFQNDVVNYTNGQLRIFFGIQQCEVIRSGKHGSVFFASKTVNVLMQTNYLCKYNKNHDLYMLTAKNDDIKYLNFNNNEKNGIHFATKDMVAVKMDLDNLGTVFSMVDSIDQAKFISDYIGKIISNLIFGMRDIEIIIAGGDDIYIICDLKKMYHYLSLIYDHLKENIENNPLFENYQFGLSAGVSRFIGGVNPFYFTQEAEDYLELAKNNGKNCIYLGKDRLSWDECKRLSINIEKYHLMSNPSVASNIFNYKYVISYLRRTRCID